jgi:predicted transcriptional regulator
MVGLPPIPQELRALRKRAHLTQKELAIRAGISQALVARIESGDVDPRLSTLRKILKVLNEVTEIKFTMRDIMHQPVITVDTEETIGKAVEVMWENGISQLPVMKGNHIVGSIREETILKKLKDVSFKDLLNSSISYLLEEPFPIVTTETNIDEVSKLLSIGIPAIVVSEHGRMIGIITKIDLIARQMM